MAGNLYKRGKTFWARVTINGREYRGSLHEVDRRKATAALADWLKRVGKPRFRGDKRLMWKAAVVAYEQKELGNVGAKTAKRYKVSLRQVTPHLERYHADEIGPAQVNDLVRERRAEGATNATINRDLTAVSRVIACAISEGAAEHNAARSYDRSMNRERRERIVLPTWAEVRAAIRKAPTPLWARVMDYASKSGMREDEILTLEKTRVDLRRRAVTLHKTKGRRLRVLPLSGPLLEDAYTILKASMKRGEALVFGHKDDETLKNFASRYAHWRRKSKVNFRFHDLRHLFAVTYLQRGGNIYDLQRILGHASIKTTELYLDYLTPEERRTAMMGESAHITAQ